MNSEMAYCNNVVLFLSLELRDHKGLWNPRCTCLGKLVDPTPNLFVQQQYDSPRPVNVGFVFGDELLIGATDRLVKVQREDLRCKSLWVEK